MDNWLMVILTFCYVILTAFILISNQKMINEAKLSRIESIRTREKTRDDSFRPEVITYFREEDGGLYFVIKNIGNRMAINITIRFYPAINVYTYLLKHNFMQQ